MSGCVHGSTLSQTRTWTWAPYPATAGETRTWAGLPVQQRGPRSRRLLEASPPSPGVLLSLVPAHPLSVLPRQLGAQFNNYTVVTTRNYSGLSLSVPLIRRTGIHKATVDSEQHCSGQPCKGSVGRLHLQMRKPRLRSALPAMVMSQCWGQDSRPWLRVVPGCRGAQSSHLHRAPCPGLALGCAPA